jgi:hypothetical protein
MVWAALSGFMLKGRTPIAESRLAADAEPVSPTKGAASASETDPANKSRLFVISIPFKQRPGSLHEALARNGRDLYPRLNTCSERRP